ncbi:flightin isoform X1 [Aethina tumida]|uniref:flightin isoform X1 n=1 Tax=Aethina tumida TaxID=116153 RepID=UPI002148949C|nr:flightin isoform X1 [Aethina tumida]
MADDDNADWFTQDDEPAAEAEAAPAAAAATGGGGGEAAAGGEEAAAGGAPAEEKVEEVEHEEYLDPDKLLLFRHWIRPKASEYRYLSNYRKYYYDDILEVLDMRRRGIRSKIPKAQSWAERILRAEKDPLFKIQKFDRFLEDVKLVTRSEISGYFHSYYSKETFNKRCSRLVY